MTVTNRRETGRIDIVKRAVGPIAGATQNFTVRVDCAGDRYDTDLTMRVPGDDGQTTATVGGIPTGVECTVTEPDGLGDSFTYGWGIEDPSHRFGDLIQGRFDAAKPGSVEVMNVAKPGWGTSDQINPLLSMIDVYSVDEVLLCHVPNDIEKLLPVSDDFNPIRPPSPGFFNLESSPLLDYLFRRIYLPRVPTVRGYHDWLAEGYTTPRPGTRNGNTFDA